MDLSQFKTEVEQELIRNILPFHIEKVTDPENGGFYGYISNDLQVKKDAPKVLIQNARLLWTYAQAYHILKNPIYLDTANWAYHYLLDYFWDKDFGGVFWLLDYQGRPLETVKKTYAQAFGIYSLAEYYLASGQPQSIEKAIEIYRRLEKHIYDSRGRGYFEGAGRDWTSAGAMQLSAVDLDAQKSMNSHLHVLEAYTTLLRAWGDAGLRAQLKDLIQVTLDYIIDQNTGHFKLFFDEKWQSRSTQISYGHDIEGSWLLVEAAEVLGDADLLAQAKIIALKMAQATYNEGLDAEGGVYNEADPSGITHPDKDWWPQAEAIVGFLNAHHLSGQPHFLEASFKSWEFIKKYIIDHQHGEWFWGVNPACLPLAHREKVGPWKSSYHNSRACIEVMRRVVV